MSKLKIASLIIFALILAGLTTSYGFFWQQAQDRQEGLLIEYNTSRQIATELGLESQEGSIVNSFWIPEISKQSDHLAELNSDLVEQNQLAYSSQLATLKEESPKILAYQKLLENLNLEPTNQVELNFEHYSAEVSLPHAKELSKVKKLVESYQTNSLSQIQEYKQKKVEAGTLTNPLWHETDQNLRQRVEDMTLEEKAAQLLIFSFEGQNLNKDQQAYWQKLQPGGFILMGGNVASPDQLQKLTSQLWNTNTQIPPFLAIDQEGGYVKRINWESTAGQLEWSNLDEEEMCSLGEQRANTLNSLGLNLNFSPVADLTSNEPGFINDRTISIDPSTVSKTIKPYIECHQKARVFTTLKHFPGHGATTADSHFVLPKISKSKEAWLQSDAIPFKENLEAEFVMVGHLHFTALDSKQPASQSKKVLTDLLKQELGYSGLIVTDGMNQLHTSTNISVPQALQNSFNAGVDIVLYVGLPQSPDQIHKELVKLISDGKISEEAVDEKVYRILKTKRKIVYN